MSRRFSAGIDTALSAKTKFAERTPKALFLQVLADSAEIVVTGIGDGLGRIQRRQIARMRAGRLKCVMRVLLVTERARVFVDHAGPQRCQRGEGFDRGAERIVFLKGDVGIDDGAHASRLWIHHDNGAATIAERESCRAL